MQKRSTVRSITSLPDSIRNKLLAETPSEVKIEKLYTWEYWARPEQLPPEGDWRTWIYLAGRGSGKTRAGAEWVRAHAEADKEARIALVGPTVSDVRNVMVKGEAGILATSPPWFKPEYIPSVRLLIWPNGAMAETFSADEPRQLRGPSHHFAWVDELAAWRYAEEAWHNLRLGLRLGSNPRAFVSTTPKPIDLIKDLVLGKRVGHGTERVPDPTVVVTRGTSYDNRLNIAEAWLDDIVSTYEGTPRGRQEIYAEIIEDVEGALWTDKMISKARVWECPELVKVVVGVDPPGGKTECGIVVAGVGEDGHGYIIEDCSFRASPEKWGKEVVLAYNRHGANKIIGEINFGGDMVDHTVMIAARDLGIVVPYEGVRTSKGKHIRAEPVAALYEQGRIHHVGKFDALEAEMTTWTPPEPGKSEKNSPNRMDAMVWAVSKLMVGFVRAKGDLGIS